MKRRRSVKGLSCDVVHIWTPVRHRQLDAGLIRYPHFAIWKNSLFTDLVTGEYDQRCV